MTNAVAERQTAALAVIEESVRAVEPDLTELLPTHIPVARVIDTVLTAARKTPDLLDCTPASFVYAIREAARWGLIPDGVMGQGYLIPRRNGKTGEMEATFMAGYRGLEDLARRSGIVGSIVSGWNCENDIEFRIQMGLHGDVVHIPALGPRGAIVGVYAAAWLLNGSPPVVVYMPVDEVYAIRDAVPRWQSGPWRSHFAQMGRKTAVRRLIGQLPLSSDIQEIIGNEDEAWREAIDVTPSDSGAGEGSGQAPEAAAAVAVLRSRRPRKGRMAEVMAPAEPAAEGEPTEPAEQQTLLPEVMEGTIRLVDRPGQNGQPVDVAGEQVIGFRLDLEGDEWAQIILSGAVLERHRESGDALRDGGIVKVTGRKIVLPTTGPDGLALPPVIRLIATEDIEWPTGS